MKKITDRKEIALALNFGKYPVVKIDISNQDEYGFVGDAVRLDMGTFKSGMKYYERCTARIYNDDWKLTFVTDDSFLSASYLCSDFVHDALFASSIIIEPETEIAVAVYDSMHCKIYGVYITTIGKFRKDCITTADCEGDFSELAHLLV